MQIPTRSSSYMFAIKKTVKRGHSSIIPIKSSSIKSVFSLNVSPLSVSFDIRKNKKPKNFEKHESESDQSRQKSKQNCLSNGLHTAYVKRRVWEPFCDGKIDDNPGNFFPESIKPKSREWIEKSIPIFISK